jgi:hypothetical protein
MISSISGLPTVPNLYSVDGVMSDDGHMVKSLSVEDLASLFGFLTRDANGNPVLQPHQDEEAPGDDPAEPSQAG